MRRILLALAILTGAFTIYYSPEQDTSPGA